MAIMERSEEAEIILANTFISIERIRQAAEFLVSDNEQYVMFANPYIVRVQKNERGDLRLAIINTELDKTIAKMISSTEIEYAKYDYLTSAVVQMIESLGFNIYK
jgi:hypothetical protein